MTDYIDIDGTNIGETDMAVKFDIGNEEPVWILKSVMDIWPEQNECGEIVVAEWFAIKEELI